MTDEARAAADITITPIPQRRPAVLHPARWVVRHDDRFQFFRTPADAEAFANELYLQLMSDEAIGDVTV